MEMSTPFALTRVTALLLLAQILCFATAPSSRAGLLDFLGLGQPKTNQPAASTTAAALSNPEVVQGLKEALGKGLQQAITQLGHNDGFLTNLNVRIPMPPRLQTIDHALQAMGEGKLVDDFIASMNHAAEQAVPDAAEVFAQALQNMTIEDAKGILTGTTNAATEYFRRTTETNLFVRFLPIVKQATDQVGVTSTYKKLMERATPAGTLGSFGRALLGSDTVDVDSYVTQKALDGLFTMVATEEQRIRQNPVARTTALLQKVFGAVASGNSPNPK